jgi:hypothetical protein
MGLAVNREEVWLFLDTVQHTHIDIIASTAKISLRRKSQ